MSPKLKNGLIIGGIVLGVVVVCLVVVALVMPRYAGSPSAAPQVDYAYDDGRGVGGGPGAEFAAEEPAMAEEIYPAEAPAAMPTMAPSQPGGGGEAQPIERLIIRNGSISMTVQDTRTAKQQIEQMVAALAGEGAFIVSSNESPAGPDVSPYIYMTLRVPATRFDEVMELLTGLAVPGTSPTVSESADDVTEQFVDIQARVESLEAARDRLLELMRDAQTTEDLLMAEQQLTQREAEIESLKGRMRYLTESARLSRIDVTLQPYILSQPVDTRWRPAETVRRAFSALVDGLRDFGDFLIFFGIAVLPWLALLALVIYLIVRFILWRVRVGQRRRAASVPPEE